MNDRDDFDEEQCGITAAEILIPQAKYAQNWGVVACDQYTQDLEYWRECERIVGGAPSALRLILPEIYLESPDAGARIATIKRNMLSYLAADSYAFAPPVYGCVFLVRKTAFGRVRKGLIAAVDLEQYDWRAGSHAYIRATEQTIPARIPPRAKIRAGAPLESPHVMLLADDPGNILFSPAETRALARKPLYDTDLMQNGGRITGYALDSREDIRLVMESIGRLARERGDFFFAVGDGNHSLAAAKSVWEDYKASRKNDPGLTNHPARYALVEIVNLYDEGLTFEPIHRILFNAPIADLCEYTRSGLNAAPRRVSPEEAANPAALSASFALVGPDDAYIFDSDASELSVSAVQPLLDSYLRDRPHSRVDYIHGARDALKLRSRDNTAVVLPPIDKRNFFASIASNGSLPRKSFSMGEASEKRYYFECRRLFS